MIFCVLPSHCEWQTHGKERGERRVGIKREAKEVCEGNKNEMIEVECCDCGREEGGGD